MTDKKTATKKVSKASLKEIKAELEKEQVQNPKEQKGIRIAFIGNARKFKDRVHTNVVDRSKKVEKFHQKAASWPLDRLAKVNRLEQVTDDLNAIQEKTINHGYDLMRTAISKVDDITDEILVRVERRYQIS